MELIQVGIIAKRNMDTGEFGTPMPICRELDTTQAEVDRSINESITHILAKKMSDYINGTKTK